MIKITVASTKLTARTATKIIWSRKNDFYKNNQIWLVRNLQFHWLFDLTNQNKSQWELSTSQISWYKAGCRLAEQRDSEEQQRCQTNPCQSETVTLIRGRPIWPWLQGHGFSTTCMIISTQQHYVYVDNFTSVIFTGGFMLSFDNHLSSLWYHFTW